MDVKQLLKAAQNDQDHRYRELVDQLARDKAVDTTELLLVSTAVQKTPEQVAADVEDRRADVADDDAKMEHEALKVELVAQRAEFDTKQVAFQQAQAQYVKSVVAAMAAAKATHETEHSAELATIATLRDEMTEAGNRHNELTPRINAYVPFAYYHALRGERGQRERVAREEKERGKSAAFLRSVGQ